MLHFSVGSPAYILSTFPCGLNYTDKLVIVNAMGTEELVKLISSILLLFCAQLNIFANE
jgi:hypothetical protein